MAINWDIQITDVNIAEGRGDIIATRTNTVSGLSRNYSMDNTPMATQEERALIMDTLKAWVVTDDNKATDVAKFITNLEQAAKSALEAWEATR